MGAKKSKPLETNRINEIALEASGCFQKEFTLAYKDCIWERVRLSKGEPSQAHPLALETAPLPTQIIKRGELYKKGAINTSWKKRVFTALNRADNYEIEYAEQEGGVYTKGRINCLGYALEVFDESDRAKYGFNGFRLLPFDESRRKWVLRAETEEEHSEWVEIFSSACRNAVSDNSSTDELQREAFRMSFRVTRASYGYFGVFQMTGSEASMLEGLIVQILRRELLEDYIVTECSCHATAAGKKAVVAAVDKEVDRIVKPIVAACWNSCLDSCSIHDSFFDSAQEHFIKILAVEDELVGLLREQIEAVMDPVLHDVEANLVKCINCLQVSTKTAFGDALQGVRGELTILLRNVSSSIEADSKTHPKTIVDREFLLLDEMVEKVVGGPLASVQALLWKMFTEDLTLMDAFLEGTGSSSFAIYNKLIGEIRSLVRNAVYTLKVLLYQQMGETIDPVLPIQQRRKSVSTRSVSTVTATGGSSRARSNSGYSSVPSTPISPGSSTPRSDGDRDVDYSEVIQKLNEVFFSSAMKEVMAKLKSDAKVRYHNTFVTLMEELIEASVQEMILIPAVELFRPKAIQSKIPKSLRIFIHTPLLCDHFVRNAVDQFINLLVESSVSSACIHFDQILT